MKTLILTLLLASLVSCKTTTTTNVSAKTTVVSVTPYNGIDYSVSFLLQKKLRYYKDLNTVFINMSKSKGKGC